MQHLNTYSSNITLDENDNQFLSTTETPKSIVKYFIKKYNLSNKQLINLANKEQNENDDSNNDTRQSSVAILNAKWNSVVTYIREKEQRDLEWKEMRRNPKKSDAKTIRIMKIQMECDRDRMLNLRVKAKLIKFIKQHLDFVQIKQNIHQQMTEDDHNWNIICQLAKTDSYTDQDEIDYLNSQLISCA